MSIFRLRAVPAFRPLPEFRAARLHKFSFKMKLQEKYKKIQENRFSVASGTVNF